MKKIFIFMSLSVLLAGCSTGEETKTKPNPFKEETTSSQVSSQSITINTTTVTTTKVTTTQKKLEFVPGRYVGNLNGRRLEIVIASDGSVDGTKMVKGSHKGYNTLQIPNAKTAEMGIPFILVPAGKETPSEYRLSNPENNTKSKPRIVVPQFGGEGIVYELVV